MSEQTTDRPSSTRGSGADYEIGFLLRQAHQRAASSFNAALAPFGVEGRHFAVLHHLARSSRSQRQLVDLSGRDKATMVRLIDDLEAKGLATREASPEDRRVRVVTLTDRGIATLRAAEDVARQVAAELLAHMPEPDRRLLTKLLSDFLRPSPR